MHNSLVLRFCQFIFDNHRSSVNHATHSSFSGVRTSENGLFLYKSNEADALIRGRFNDFFWLGSLGMWASGAMWLMFLPLAAITCTLPRKMSHVHYFTYHAELLPHTEQVVFHKTALFGRVRRIFVDIKNLEKVEHTHVPAPLLWNINKFD
jgi:hypothetical protein